MHYHSEEEEEVEEEDDGGNSVEQSSASRRHLSESLCATGSTPLLTYSYVFVVIAK